MIDEDTILEYKKWLLDKELEIPSINSYLRAVHAFLFYAMRNNYLEKFQISELKDDEKQKDPHNEDAIIRLIKKPDLSMIGFVEYRSWVAVCYFLETGNRLNRKNSINSLYRFTLFSSCIDPSPPKPYRSPLGRSKRVFDNRLAYWCSDLSIP